jgi:hypothetical protein
MVDSNPSKRSETFRTERSGTSGRDNKYDTQHTGEPERRAVRQRSGGALFRDRRAAPVLVVRMNRTVNWEGAWKTIQTSA